MRISPSSLAQMFQIWIKLLLSETQMCQSRGPDQLTGIGFYLFQASHKDQKKIQKTMSSGDLGKVEVLRKTSSQDGR